MAPNPIYQQIPQNRFLILRNRYDTFLERINDPSKDVVKIFDTLGPQQQQELELIRAVTKELQEKKEEDMKKAEQAAEEASKAEAEAAKEESDPKVESQEETENKTDEQETVEKVDV